MSPDHDFDLLDSIGATSRSTSREQGRDAVVVFLFQELDHGPNTNHGLESFESHTTAWFTSPHFCSSLVTGLVDSPTEDMGSTSYPTTGWRTTRKDAI